jgi:hypothetical protein
MGFLKTVKKQITQLRGIYLCLRTKRKSRKLLTKIHKKISWDGYGRCAYNSSTWEAEIGGLWVWGQPGLHREIALL